jgi:site-specific recombinase XerD
MTNRTDTQGGAMTLEKGLAAFLDTMLGKNRSAGTLRAYRTDIWQFITFLHENNVAITGVADVGKVDVLEYLAALARKGLTGVARARKVSAIREYFRFLEGLGVIERSPAAGIDTPKREKHTRQFLRSDEYTKMLSLAACRRELFDHRLRHIVHLAYEQKISNRRLRSNPQFHRHVARMSAA